MVVPQTEKARWPNCVRVCRMMAAQDVVERTLVNSINVLYCCALPFSWQLFLDLELISYHYSSCFCCAYHSSSCWGDLFKKCKALSFQIRSGWYLAGLFFK